jgi:hypothetical protein
MVETAATVAISHVLRGCGDGTTTISGGTSGALDAEMRKSLLGIALAIVACSDDVGRSSASVDTICNQSAAATLDGIPAYGFCGNFDVWTKNGVDTQSTSGGVGWTRTETNYGYQCAEYALRYSRFAFGVTTVWTGISYADQMCATHPASMSVTANPVHGDLMVFAGGTCGTASPGGHVAVVDSVAASTVDVVQENPAGKVTWVKACASCFLHADHNHGASDPCEASTADGVYCGQTIKLSAGTSGVLYTCNGGVTAASETCAAGCVIEPAKTPDQCAAIADAGPSDASTPDAGADADAMTTVEDAAPPPPPPPTESSGCSSSGTPARGDLAFVVALALSFCGLRRRRSARAKTVANGRWIDKAAIRR